MKYVVIPGIGTNDKGWLHVSVLASLLGVSQDDIIEFSHEDLTEGQLADGVVAKTSKALSALSLIGVWGVVAGLAGAALPHVWDYLGDWFDYMHSDRTYWTVIASLGRVMGSLEPDTPVTLIGHSMGGVMALEYASRNPQIKRVITLGAPICYKPIYSNLRLGKHLSFRWVNYYNSRDLISRVPAPSVRGLRPQNIKIPSSYLKLSRNHDFYNYAAEVNLDLATHHLLGDPSF